MDIELTKILLKECKDRAAANVGEERRFFQALVNTLKDSILAEEEYDRLVYGL